MMLEGIATARSCAGTAFSLTSYSSEILSRGKEKSQQNGFWGTTLLLKETMSGQRRQQVVRGGVRMRASEGKPAKPPVFILNVKPERKPRGAKTQEFNCRLEKVSKQHANAKRQLSDVQITLLTDSETEEIAGL